MHQAPSLARYAKSCGKAARWAAIFLLIFPAAGCKKSNPNNQTGPGFLSNVQGAANNSNGGSNSSTSSSNTAPAVQPPKVVTLPQGTVLDVTLQQAISTRDAQRGEAFDATLSRDVDANGGVAIPAGSRVHGTVMAAAPGGRANAPASLVLALSDVELAGANYPVRTSTVTRKGQVDTKSQAEGAAAGGFIGGVASKTKGFFKGAKTGATAGASTAAAITNKDISIGTDSVLAFRLEQPVSLPVKQ
jgi:hypothetical protein